MLTASHCQCCKCPIVSTQVLDSERFSVSSSINSPFCTSIPELTCVYRISPYIKCGFIPSPVIFSDAFSKQGKAAAEVIACVSAF